jgi:homoserine O-acetyltransferase
MTKKSDTFQIAEMGDAVLQSGATLRGAKLAYKTHGTLNAARDNAIVYPTWYGGQHSDNEWLIGPGLALDPARYFIIVPDMLGNGLSSSPSNTPAPYNQARFPHVTAYDNVKLQHRLVTETFGIETLELVTGWSMGALQSYHWGSMYPSMVKRMLPSCGSARCSPHNFVFLEGVKAALTADGRKAFTTSRLRAVCARWAASTRAGAFRRRFIARSWRSRRLDIRRSRTFS